MMRTQQTASSIATAVAEPVQILPDLREAEAGELVNQPETEPEPTLSSDAN